MQTNINYKKYRLIDRILFLIILLLLIYITNRKFTFINNHSIYTYLIVSIFSILILIPFTGNKLIRIWMFISKIIGKIISTILLTFIYFIVIVPISLFSRISSKNEKTTWMKTSNEEIDYTKMG